MKYLLALLCCLPFALIAQAPATTTRTQQHTTAQQDFARKALPTEFARARLRYTESLTEGDAATRRVSRDGMIALMERSVALQRGQAATNQRALLKLFRRYATASDPESVANANRVIADFEKTLKPTTGQPAPAAQPAID